MTNTFSNTIIYNFWKIHSVTIVANQTTQANVRNGKYFREGKITVKVVDAFGAKQTGTNQITVTGTDLSDKVADYSLKLGNAARTLSKADKKEDGSVVLTTTASRLSAGTYTLTFGDKKTEITCEESKATSIVLEPEGDIAIMTSTNSAVVYFKVVNQFGEDVTKKANLSVTGTDIDPANNDFSKGEIKFTNSQPYSLNLTKLSVSIADRESGIFHSTVLTVGDASRLAEASIAGVYKVTGNAAVKTTLEEGLRRTQIGDYYLLLSGTNQYGLEFNPEDLNASSISIVFSSMTGLTIDVPAAQKNVKTKTVEVDGVKYAAFKLGVDQSTTFDSGLKSGEVSVIGYVLTSGKQISATIAVGSDVKIASLKINSASVYGGTVADLEYEALDTEGNSVTDINVLRKFNNTTNFKEAKMFFVGNKDGAATLKLNLRDEKVTTQTMKNLSWMSDTNVFGYTTVTVLPNSYPVGVVGVWTVADSTNGVYLAITGSTTSAINITAKDLKYEDQYGNIIPKDAYDSVVSGSGIKLTAVIGTEGKDGFKSITSEATSGAITDASKKIVSFAAPENCSKAAVTKITVNSETVADKSGGTVRKSEHSFDIAAIPMTACNGNVKAFYYNDNHYVTGTALTATPVVQAFFGSSRVRIIEGKDYSVYAGVAPLDPAVVGTNATGSGKASVVVTGSAQTIRVDYKTGNAAPKVISATLYNAVGGKEFSTNGFADVAKNTKIDWNAYLFLGVSTQYTNANSASPRISISNLPSNEDAYSLSGNGSTGCDLRFKEAGFYGVTVTLDWADGYTCTETVYFNVK